MKHSRNALLSLAAAVMEFTWLYAWATFSTISMAQRNTPPLEAAVIFLAGALITGLSTGRGLRVISIVLLQTAGIVYTVLRTIYIFGDFTSAFLSRQWLVEFFDAPHSMMEWILLVVAVFWSLAFWAGGARFAVRPKTHEKICSRFDLGVAAFLCLLLMKFALQVKGNVSVNDPLTGPLACIFFFFGLTSIGMIRGQTSASPDLAAGYRKFGVVMGFISAVFASVVTLVVFFQHPLTSVAGVSYGIIRGGVSSIGMIFIGLIRFLYLPRQSKAIEPASNQKENIFDRLSSSGHPAWMEVVEKIFGWLFGTALGLIMLAIIVFSVFYFVKWLLSRTRKDHSSKIGWGALLLRVFVRVRDLFTFLAGKARQTLKGYRTAADFYIALIQWSRLSGIRRRLDETPSEFCSRLAGMFPVLREEIDTIVGAFNREFYGEMVLDSGEIAGVRLAWRTLRSPARWPLRLRAFFSGTINPLP
ncbi:MAG: hypothetical protein A4E63_02842 [Syntrophorhabdus sp. PtaU1.Bin050]|nr:MAG: hypothetical protein A4E63_02842 [Syntrophorhabdus sp. PtaU1.Bin050]